MASRFSQLFTSPVTMAEREEASLGDFSSHSRRYSYRSPEPKPKRKSLGKMLIHLFRSRKPQSASSHQSPQSYTKGKNSILKRKSVPLDPVTVSPFTTHLHRSAISISSLPLPGQKPRLSNSRASTFEVDKTRSIRDSNFSTVSSRSTLSFHTASSFPSTLSTSTPLLYLSPDHFSQLTSLTRRLNRSLRKQERHAQSFSGNVAFLMGRKERTVELNRRLKTDARREMLGLMHGLRGLVGQCFLRKAVFMERSCQIARILLGGEQIVDLRQHGDDKEGLVEVRLNVDTILANLNLLKDDLTVQRGLDTALRGGIGAPCEDLRLPATENERIVMRRFVVFVDLHLARLETFYAQMGSLIESLENLLTELKVD